MQFPSALETVPSSFTIQIWAASSDAQSTIVTSEEGEAPVDVIHQSSQTNWVGTAEPNVGNKAVVSVEESSPHLAAITEAPEAPN